MARIRIFAGPNGSGKSTLFSQLQREFNLGHYLNADDLLQQLQETLLLDLTNYNVFATQKEWESFWQKHGLKNRALLLTYSNITNNILVFNKKPESYEMAILTDFLRHLLLRTAQTFSFETVFSHSSKLDLMHKAVKSGYRCYLYFVATSSADIGTQRIHQRVSQGGHDVPEDKTKERYFRALNNLLPAMRIAYRSYIFDNSNNMELIAETTPEQNMLIRSNRIPIWFNKYVLEKLTT